MEIVDNHGRVTKVNPGQFVVNEYYKGFLNNVYVFNDSISAEFKKRTLELGESVMMNSPKHFRVKGIR